MLLSGCTDTVVVSNPYPEPYFPSCSTLKDLERPSAPDSAWKDWVRQVNINLKLRENQPKKERDEFINCKTGKPIADS